MSPTPVQLAKLRAHPNVDSEPFVTLSLLKFRGEAAATRYLELYGTPTRKIIQDVGGKPLWAGRAEQLLVGRVSWDLAVLVWYPSRRAFLQMMERADHRALLPVRQECLEAAIQIAADEMIRDFAAK